MKLQVITAKLTNKKLFELFKIQMPIHIIFVNKEDNQINHDYTIEIVDRVFKDGKNRATIKRGKNLFTDDYDRFITLIDMHINEGYSYQVLADETDIFKKKKLLEFLGKIEEDLVNKCVYLDYNHIEKYFEIRYPNLDNGNSQVIYFFPNDKSILQFSENNPELFLSPSINNISDLICD